MIRRYPTHRDAELSVFAEFDPPPADAFARLAWASVRLRDAGFDLVARVPPAVAASPEWPRLDRLLARYSPWLADVAAVVAAARQRFPLARVESRLREITPPLAEAAYELAGGRRRFRALVRRPPTRARADLAFAIFAILLQIEGVIGRPEPRGQAEALAGGATVGRVLDFRPGPREGARSW